MALWVSNEFQICFVIILDNNDKMKQNGTEDKEKERPSQFYYSEQLDTFHLFRR